VLNSQKVIRININDISYVSLSTFITPSLLLILNQLMLVAASCSLNFTLLLAEIFQLPLFSPIIFSLLLLQEDNKQREVKQGRQGGVRKLFKLEIYSSGHTLFTN